MSVQTVQTMSRTENVIRWILFVPAALCGCSAVQNLVTLQRRILLGPGSEMSVLQTIGLGWVILLGGALFVWIGAMVAPSRQRKTAIILFWVYAVLITLIELFRTPVRYEPLPHLVRVGLGLVGAIGGLSLALHQIKGRARRAAAGETEGK